jgi:nucleoside-diphosphate-sugar epimerase
MAGPFAVIGGGYLGARVARALPPPVVMTTRRGAPDDASSGVHVLALDVTDPQLDVRPLATVCAAVICYAPGRTQSRETLYVDGTRRLLRALVAPRRLTRIVYVSSTSACADRDGWVHEDDTELPRSDRGRVQREAEDVVRRTCEAHGVAWIVLRLGGLYGPGRALGQIYRRRGTEPLPGDGHTPTNLIHVDDATTSVLAALNASSDYQGVVQVCDDDHCTRRDMYARLAPPEGTAPIRWQEEVPVGAPPHGKRVSNLRLKLELGVVLQHPGHSHGVCAEADLTPTCAPTVRD